MGEAKHTLGPWTVDGPPYNQIVWSSAENRVCFLAHSNGLDDDRDLATGRLIAAAPDMYAALIGILSNPGGRCSAEQWRAGLDALAKAEGRS